MSVNYSGPGAGTTPEPSIRLTDCDDRVTDLVDDPDRAQVLHDDIVGLGQLGAIKIGSPETTGANSDHISYRTYHRLEGDAQAVQGQLSTYINGEPAPTGPDGSYEVIPGRRSFEVQGATWIPLTARYIVGQYTRSPIIVRLRFVSISEPHRCRQFATYELEVIDEGDL